MGLFDGYFDPEQFGEGGGLLGRLLALQQMQGLYQPDAGLNQPAPDPQATVLQPMSWPSPPAYGGPPSDPQPAPNLASQYQALRPILGDHAAMLATVNPDVGKTLIAQAMATQQLPGNFSASDLADRGAPVTSNVSPPEIQPDSQYAQAAMRAYAGSSAISAAGAWSRAGEAPVPIPATEAAAGAFLQPAQFWQFFARPPVIFPRVLRPLEEIPRGSSGGPNAGKRFSRQQNDKPDGTPCTYCGTPTLRSREPHPDRHHGDHAIPRAQGGNSDDANYNDSCQTCNLRKRDRNVEEWYEDESL